MQRSSMFSFATPLFVAALALCGCATSYQHADRHELRGEAINAVVPQSACLVKAGQQHVACVSPASGKLYVFDTKTERLVYTGPVERGQKLNVDAVHKRVAIDGEVAAEPPLVWRHTYQLYLDISSDEHPAAARPAPGDAQASACQ